MGLIARLLGLSRAGSEIGRAIEGVAEVFVPNATKKMTLSHAGYMAALNEFGVEFSSIREGWFDRFVNGLNRLPRPALAIGTLGLFTYAMVSPEGFSVRMQSLALVPEPLWWLLGAIVSFYFGAREMHYFRGDNFPSLSVDPKGGEPGTQPQKADDPNAALAEWHSQR